MKELVEINGVQYVRKPNDKPKSRGGLYALYAMATIYNGYSIETGGGPAPKPTIDLIEEYKLVLAKKSKLSKANRDWVVRTFERNYIKVK